MPNYRKLPKTDAGLVCQWSNDNENAINELECEVARLESKLGEAKRELIQRKLARPRYADMIMKLGGE